MDRNFIDGLVIDFAGDFVVNVVDGLVIDFAGDFDVNVVDSLVIDFVVDLVVNIVDGLVIAFVGDFEGDFTNFFGDFLELVPSHDSFVTFDKFIQDNKIQKIINKQSSTH